MIKLAILTFLFSPLMLFSQTGKVVGKVTDAQTGGPLIGANVIIDETYLGAATDLEGNILILNVNPGTYNFRASYIGYQDMVIENIRVSVNLTTEVSFQMQEEALQSETIVIVAEKPLINKNVTNSTSIISAEEIDNLPLRNMKSIVSLQTGVVNQGGNLYIRGSRMDQVAFYMDGVLVNDMLIGGEATSMIKNAVEEIQVQAGGYSAEYGGANGGIIITHGKIGGESYHFNAELITDNFAPVGKKFFWGYSYGQSEYALTFSGPVVPSFKRLKFFIAANNMFLRSEPKFYTGIDQKNIYDPILASTGKADTFDVYYPEGFMVNGHQNTFNVQGNVTWDLHPVTFKLNGSYRYSEGRNGVDILDYNTRDRAPINESETITAGLKLTHILTNRSFYDVIVTYMSDFTIPCMDPIFRHNITAYGDSIENYKVGTLLEGDGALPVDFHAYGQDFRSRARPWHWYYKRRQTSLGIAVNFLYQLGKHNEIKVGADYRRFEMRRYDLFPVSISRSARLVGDGDPREIYEGAQVWNYGYDLYGNQTDTGLQAPKYPVFASFYIQDKLEFADLIINAGLRFDYLYTDDQELINPHHIKFDENDMAESSSFRDLKAFTKWSPRLGFSFPVSEKTIFHAHYGKFYQQSRLRDVYSTYNKASIKNYWTGVGFGIKPEKTTQYEIGFRQQLGNNFAFDLTMFYKDIKEQVRSRLIYAEPGANHGAYLAYVNGDFETAKGIEIKANLRRSKRIAGSFNYTFSDARGTGSNSWNMITVGADPTSEIGYLQQIAPTDFNQTHKGSAILDYRFGVADGGPILQQMGLNLIFQFSSGFNYTRVSESGFRNGPIESLNYSTTPWTYQLDLKLDKSFIIEPVTLNVYMWITNVLNAKNILQVFDTTGDAYDDGYLKSDEGSTRSDNYAAYGEDKRVLYQELHKAITYNPDHFGQPRQIQLGVRLEY